MIGAQRGSAGERIKQTSIARIRINAYRGRGVECLSKSSEGKQGGATLPLFFIGRRVIKGVALNPIEKYWASNSTNVGVREWVLPCLPYPRS